METEPTQEAEAFPLAPEVASLLDRYRVDDRFNGHEEKRAKCMEVILKLNNFIQKISQEGKIPPNVKAILLTGSLSERSSHIPRFYTGGEYVGELISDIDLLVVQENGKRKFKYQDGFFNRSEFARFLQEEAKINMFIHETFHIGTINRLPRNLFPNKPKDVVPNMLDTATLLYGQLPPDTYGQHRDGGSPIKPAPSDWYIEN